MALAAAAQAAAAVVKDTATATAKAPPRRQDSEDYAAEDFEDDFDDVEDDVVVVDEDDEDGGDESHDACGSSTASYNRLFPGGHASPAVSSTTVSLSGFSPAASPARAPPPPGAAAAAAVAESAATDESAGSGLGALVRGARRLGKGVHASSTGHRTLLFYVWVPHNWSVSACMRWDRPPPSELGTSSKCKLATLVTSCSEN